jgi:hypothetical protein
MLCSAAAGGGIYAGREAVEDGDAAGAYAAREPVEDGDAVGAYAGREAVEDGDAAGAAAGRCDVDGVASGAMPADAGAAATIVVPHCTQNLAPGCVS